MIIIYKKVLNAHGKYLVQHNNVMNKIQMSKELMFHS